MSKRSPRSIDRRMAVHQRSRSFGSRASTKGAPEDVPGHVSRNLGELLADIAKLRLQSLAGRDVEGDAVPDDRAILHAPGHGDGVRPDDLPVLAQEAVLVVEYGQVARGFIDRAAPVRVVVGMDRADEAVGILAHGRGLKAEHALGSLRDVGILDAAVGPEDPAEDVAGQVVDDAK